MSAITSKAGVDKINSFFGQMQDETQSNSLAYLYSRWLDEREYEDFKDYASVIRKSVPAGLRAVKVTKSPFGLTFTVDSEPGNVYSMSVNSKSLTWKRIK